MEQNATSPGTLPRTRWNQKIMMEQRLFLGRIESPIQLQNCLGKKTKVVQRFLVFVTHGSPKIKPKGRHLPVSSWLPAKDLPGQPGPRLSLPDDVPFLGHGHVMANSRPKMDGKWSQVSFEWWRRENKKVKHFGIL